MDKIPLFQFLFRVDPRLMSLENYRKIAQQKRWKTSLAGPLIMQVERDLLTFDTFSILAAMAKDELSFGGGTLLNWVYLRDSPRFSFDIDTQLQYPASSKEEIMNKLVERINNSLRKSGTICPIEINNKRYEVGAIYFDKEKDHFPNLLSLIRTVHAYTAGAKANVYLKKVLQDLNDKEMLKIKSMYSGKFCNIEEVRIEIGFFEKSVVRFPTKEISVEPLVNPEAQISPVKANVTEIEFIIASKIHRLGKRYSNTDLENAIQDFIKALCDVRNWKDTDLQQVKHYLDQICINEGSDPKDVIKNSDILLTWLQSNSKAQNWFERGAQTSMLATKISYPGLIRNVQKLIVEIKQMPS